MHDRPDASAEQAPQIPGDDELLAAARRAAQQDPRQRRAVPAWVLLEHLEIRRRSARARLVRDRLTALEQRGWLERSSLRGVALWTLTAAGTRRLRRAERSYGPILLPESPQHRAWRRARALADQELERFGTALRESSAQLELLLQQEQVGSDEWLALGARLARDCRLLACARHCLSEWPEPDETKPDIDTLNDTGDERLAHDRRRALQLRRAGRRNTRLWSELG